MEHEIELHARQLQITRFLQEQQDLSEKPIIHEPVIITNRNHLQIDRDVRIDSFVKIEAGQGCLIGKCVHIASFAHIGIGGGVTIIEDYASVASGARIISGSNQTDGVSMSACVPPHMQHVERKRTVLKRYATVLAGATVLPGVTLHEGAVLAAGGVATKDIPAWEIWGGVPARFMSKREVRS